MILKDEPIFYTGEEVKHSLGVLRQMPWQ